MSALLQFNMVRTVTPSDTVDFKDGPCDALYIGFTGDVSCQINGLTSVFAGVPAGSILPVKATRVNEAATSASSMLWLKQV